MSYKRKEQYFNFREVIQHFWESFLNLPYRFFGDLQPILGNLDDKDIPIQFPAQPLNQILNKEAIGDLPLVSYTGPIYLISTPKDMLIALRFLKKERILGFDTETRPVFRRGEYYPVALLQLTGVSGSYIFQLSPLRHHLKPLFRILSNASIVKAGVAIRDDIRRLKERCDFKEAGFVEISHLTTQLGITHTGLRNLAAFLLGVRISKAAQVSNWGLRYLTAVQLTYAATDAWISRLLYTRAQDLLKNNH